MVKELRQKPKFLYKREKIVRAACFQLWIIYVKIIILIAKIFYRNNKVDHTLNKPNNNIVFVVFVF
jgi:hypothetical protein